MGKISDDQLPPLPKPVRFDYDHGADMGTPVYSEAQMRKYALDTLRRAEARQAPLPAGTVTEYVAGLVHTQRATAKLLRESRDGYHPSWSDHMETVADELEAAFAARPALDEAEQKRYFDAGWEKAKLLLKPEDPAPGLVEARTALEWYAEQVENCRSFAEKGHAARGALDADGGSRARTALASITETGGTK